MNAKEALQEIKKLLFTETQNNKQEFALVEAKLVDGTVVKYDLETADIFVVGQDGADVPAPVGEHQLETGEVLVVETEGKIKEVKEVQTPAEEGKEEDMKDAPKEDVPAEDKMAKFEVAFEELSKKVEEMAKTIEEMKKQSEKMTEAVQLSAQVLETLAKEPSAEPIQKPNTIAKEVRNEKQDKFNRLQKAFTNLKTK